MFNFERTSITTITTTVEITRSNDLTRNAEWPTTSRRVTRSNFLETMEDMRSEHELKMSNARHEHNVQIAQSYAAHEAKLSTLKAAKELEERLARIF